MWIAPVATQLIMTLALRIAIKTSTFLRIRYHEITHPQVKVLFLLFQTTFFRYL